MDSKLALAQGVFYFLTGIWPIVSIGTFQMVTGPKVDLWLVKTVGAMIVVVGAILVVSGLRDSVHPEIILLAVGSAAALTLVDIIYVAKGVIAKIYLLDAVVEIGIIACWVFVVLRG